MWNLCAKHIQRAAVGFTQECGNLFRKIRAAVHHRQQNAVNLKRRIDLLPYFLHRLQKLLHLDFDEDDDDDDDDDDDYDLGWDKSRWCGDAKFHAENERRAKAKAETEQSIIIMTLKITARNFFNFLLPY